MTISILDQNRITSLNSLTNNDTIILSPIFFWELYNNINTLNETKYIESLKQISNSIVVTYKSIECVEIELNSKEYLLLDRMINKETTQLIKNWLNTDNPSISYIRDTFSVGLTSTIFMDKFTDSAQSIWLPKLRDAYMNFNNGRDRNSARKKFEEIDDEISNDLCCKSISACVEILRNKNFTEEQAILFLKEPTVLYNRVFCYSAIYFYRSTESDKNSKNTYSIANDLKDVEYLFLSHYIESLLSNDKVMNYTFLHLKKSHIILSKMETGL